MQDQGRLVRNHGQEDGAVGTLLDLVRRARNHGHRGYLLATQGARNGRSTPRQSDFAQPVVLIPRRTDRSGRQRRHQRHRHRPPTLGSCPRSFAGCGLLRAWYRVAVDALCRQHRGIGHGAGRSADGAAPFSLGLGVWLSSSAEWLQRKGGTAAVDLGDCGVNATVEVVEVEHRLVGEEVAFEVPPIALDVVEFRRVLG